MEESIGFGFMECATGYLALLGFGNFSCSKDIWNTQMKVVFLILDIVSTALDWRMIRRLWKNNDYEVYVSIRENEYELRKISDETAQAYSIVFGFLICIGHILSSRGKWYTLNFNDHIAALCQSEIAVFVVEDVPVLYLFFYTEGLFDSSDFLDRMNLVLSNMAGYVPILLIWIFIIRHCQCSRSSDLLPMILFDSTCAILSLFISFLSYGMLYESVTVFDAAPVDDDSEEDSVLSPRYNYVMIIVLGYIALMSAGVWVVFVMPWSWGFTLRWLPEDIAKTNSNSKINVWMFVLAQTSIFIVAFCFGWFLE